MLPPLSFSLGPLGSCQPRLHRGLRLLGFCLWFMGGFRPDSIGTFGPHPSASGGSPAKGEGIPILILFSLHFMATSVAIKNGASRFRPIRRPADPTWRNHRGLLHSYQRGTLSEVSVPLSPMQLSAGVAPPADFIWRAWVFPCPAGLTAAHLPTNSGDAWTVLPPAWPAYPPG